MSFLSFFTSEKKTACVAKERLQLILSHERNGRSAGADFWPQLQKELLEVIAKYIKVDSEDIKVQMERQANFDVFEVKIEIPEKPGH